MGLDSTICLPECLTLGLNPTWNLNFGGSALQAGDNDAPTSTLDVLTPANTMFRMSLALAKLGGIGVIHRNLSIEKQINEVRKVKKKNYLVGAAIGVNDKDLERIEELVKVKTDLIVIDTAHGHTKKVLTMVKKIKKRLKNSSLCVGNRIIYESIAP